MSNWEQELPDWQRNQGAAVFCQMGIKEGARIIDFGCGPGRYTIAAAYAARDGGEVFAFDTSHYRLAEAASAAEKMGLGNVKMIKADGSGSLTFAEDASVDMVMIYDLIHQLGSAQETFLRETMRVLKSGGVLSVLPFHINGKALDRLFEKISSYGFDNGVRYPNAGLHFEMHEFSYGSEGHIKDIETGDIFNFRKTGDLL